MVVALRTHLSEQKDFELKGFMMKKKNIFLKGKTQGYKGELGSEIITTTVPRQRCQKCLLVFLSISRRNLEVHGYTVVALHLEVFRVLYFPEGTDV